MDGKYYCKLIKYHRVANRYSATILMTKKKLMPWNQYDP